MSRPLCHTFGYHGLTLEKRGGAVKREVADHFVHRLLAGQPVCLLTVRYRGKENVMALGWASPISLAPPLIALAIHPSRYTHDMLVRGEECVLNIPPRPMAEQLWRCGKISGADVDKFQEIGLVLETPKRVEAPWIEGCLAHIECAVVDLLTPGDHTLFIVQVVGAWAEEEAFEETWKIEGQPEELLPFYHLGGGHFGLMTKTFKLS